MYYKIENPDCDVYKKLHALRTKELQMEADNKAMIRAKTGLDFESYLGHPGQQNFGRVTEYEGFRFTDPEQVDLKIWKIHPKHNNIYVPNTRTKKGREMRDLLNNGLQRQWFDIVYDCLGIEHPHGKFTFPYVEICAGIIVIFLDDKTELNAANIIESTKREFDTLIDLN